MDVHVCWYTIKSHASQGGPHMHTMNGPKTHAAAKSGASVCYCKGASTET